MPTILSINTQEMLWEGKKVDIIINIIEDNIGNKTKQSNAPNSKIKAPYQINIISRYLVNGNVPEWNRVQIEQSKHNI